MDIILQLTNCSYILKFSLACLFVVVTLTTCVTCLSLVSQSQEDLVREMSAGTESMPAVKHYEQKEFSGMLEYSKTDELVVVKKLILG